MFGRMLKIQKYKNTKIRNVETSKRRNGKNGENRYSCGFQAEPQRANAGASRFRQEGLQEVQGCPKTWVSLYQNAGFLFYGSPEIPPHRPWRHYTKTKLALAAWILLSPPLKNGGNYQSACLTPTVNA
jgi:hypothetical protein